VSVRLLHDCDLRHLRIPQLIRHDVIRQLEREKIPAVGRIITRRSTEMYHAVAQVHHTSSPHVIPVAPEVVTVGHVRDIPAAVLSNIEANEVVELEAVFLDVLGDNANLD
jgi:hypothetical protein